MRRLTPNDTLMLINKPGDQREISAIVSVSAESAQCALVYLAKPTFFFHRWLVFEGPMAAGSVISEGTTWV